MTISRLESLDLLQREAPGNLARTAVGQHQMGSVFRSDQLSGYQQDALAQGLQRCGLELGGQTQPLEPVDEVVSEQQQVEVGFVGEKMPRWDSADAVVALQLANDQLDGRAVVVEAPEVQGLQVEIG